MSDDLADRREKMWKMEEVRSGDVDIDEADTADTADTTDAADVVGSSDTTDIEDTPDKVGLADSQATEDPSDMPDRPDTPDTADTSRQDLPSDATIRQLFLAADGEGLTVGDLRNVNVYLFDRIHGEMNNLLAEVNYRAMKQRGQEVQMNKEFFNAVYRVAARHEDEVLSELELES